MYFEMNNVFLKYNFDIKLMKCQYAYDIRTWPIGLNVKFPITLKEDDVYSYEFEDEYLENHLIITHKMVGRSEENFMYFIFEATLYQRYDDKDENICEEYNEGKIFFTPHLDALNYCCKEWDIEMPKNLCTVIVNNQISPGGLKSYLGMARKEYDKKLRVLN